MDDHLRLASKWLCSLVFLKKPSPYPKLHQKLFMHINLFQSGKKKKRIKKKKLDGEKACGKY